MVKIGVMWLCCCCGCLLMKVRNLVLVIGLLCRVNGVICVGVFLLLVGIMLVKWLLGSGW